ncbi:cupin domain-containing protein [Kitasatospora sp. NBC_00070]|uniref:cupin domain-containing protein n=1 Tax=Kitasatospora sp. NBC_00070 TaxID=2975962 RepID=UPI003254A38B
MSSGSQSAMGGLVLDAPPAVTAAYQGSGLAATDLAIGTTGNGLALGTEGGTDVVFREITIAPGGNTGWHYHPGQVLVVVKSGTLTRVLEDRSTEVTPAGGVVVEAAGARHVHIGYNHGTEPVVLLATYLAPAGSPLSVCAPAPGCG